MKGAMLRNLENCMGIASFIVDGFTPQEAGMIFDQQFGMTVRTGLNCAPMAHECIGTLPRGTVRVGFGWFNRMEEIDALHCPHCQKKQTPSLLHTYPAYKRRVSDSTEPIVVERKVSCRVFFWSG